MFTTAMYPNHQSTDSIPNHSDINPMEGLITKLKRVRHNIMADNLDVLSSNTISLCKLPIIGRTLTIKEIASAVIRAVVT